ncbi:hypothetical protein EJ07DRAFT_168669 [Lizonia empirigonia]|nr:hypothetical protein EJ07DRAFT_168669 [Lizonia empirigonia]
MAPTSPPTLNGGEQFATAPYLYNGKPHPPPWRGQVRAIQACNHCRTQKQNLDCHYKGVPPPKPDRGTATLQESVNKISHVLVELVGGFTSWRESVESRLPPAPTSSSTTSLNPSRPQQSYEEVRNEDSMGAIGTPPKWKDESGLESDHTTPAHKLFEEWHSMAGFCHGERPWGYPPADTSSPGTVLGEGPTSHPKENHGGLGPDGRPGFHSAVLWELYDSYIDNIHKLHPFMNASKLRRLVEQFSEQYSPDFNGKHAGSPAATSLGLRQGLKRKRSGSAYGEPWTSKGPIERSLRNALVLLVLALGKVCAHHDPLPSPQSDKMSFTNGSWGVHANGSFNSDTSDDNRPRNVDILPGMGYFAYATEILGNQQGGNTVAHAQAMILAALYLIQFARVLESWSWINNACRVALVLIKADYQKLDRKWYLENKASLPPKERHRLNLVMCVYWTCSMFMYSSQIWLRVILNEAHNMLYGRNARRRFDIHNIKEIAHRATTHISILEDWRRVLPPTLAWNDDDPPATDINVARLHDQRSIIGVAAKCINAAIQSTIAFDRVGAAPGSKYVKFDASARTRRLVVTNIFGTMHAQFGNMLVLAAVFKSQLCRYLPRDTQLTKNNLILLMDRTCRVLGEIAPNSPILCMDIRILRSIQKQLDLYP